LSLTTSTLTTTKGDNVNSATQGIITIKQQVTLGAASTITTPIAAPVQTGATTGVTWGTASATILSGAGTAQQVVAVTIPFTTPGPVTGASVGTISTTLSLSSGASVTSVATALNSPSVTDTLLQAKAQAYRYVLFADCITACGAGTNPSGIAEQVGTPKAGNDIIIGLGPESGFTTSENNIAGTFMHELGHSLGLQHGGPQYTYTGSTKTLVPDSTQNCKPNYESVMSYSRQFTTYLGSAWTLNYSSGTFGPLTETALSEPTGLVGNPAILSTPPTIVYGYNSAGTYKGTTSTTVNSGQTNPGIDWDKSGAVSGTVSAPIQDLGITGCNTATALSSPISDYNDWLNLNYNFTSAGSFNAISPNPISLPEITVNVSDQQTGQITPHFISTWGSLGTTGGQFKSPYGIAVNSTGYVYVSDSGNNRIEIFSSAGVLKTIWGTSGSGNGQFRSPSGVAVDSSGYVYVSDTGNNRIEKFSRSGTFITKWGTSGSGNGQFKSPSGVAVDSSGNVYVSDTGNNRIEKFSNTYTFSSAWGTSGSGNGQFNTPIGIALDSSGNVYVADKENDRIQEFTNTGTFITKWGSTGSGSNQFDDPIGIALDSSGNSYIVDTNHNRIAKWGP
jgi:DNA-binding beta-propeller fold protein YncE